MANYSGGASVICPFYIREKDKSISCESHIGDSNLTRFSSPEAKVTWQKYACCRKDYAARCEYARLMQEKYEDG